MRTNKLLSLIIVLGMGFSACYDENDIHTTKGDIPYELKEGEFPLFIFTNISFLIVLIEK